MDKIYQHRIEKIRDCLDHHHIDTLMVSIQENRFYLSGLEARDMQFNESAGTLFITKEHLILATNTLYALEAKEQCPLYDIHLCEKGLAKAIPTILKKLNTKTLGVESIRLSYKQYLEISDAIHHFKTGIKIKSVEDVVENFRVIKSPDEIEKTKRAVEITERVFLKCLDHLEVGMSEKSVAWMLEKMIRDEGASDLSFPIIMASGPNSALPHATPTDRKIQKGEPLLFDFGIILENYCSDMTRTVIFGTPDETFTHAVTVVHDALQKATAIIKKGVSSKDVDSIAREHIESNGFKGKFTHSLGHGTGLAVHELPRLSQMKETRLDTGMIVTVEPGVYMEGWGGIRLENQVVVEEDGVRVLNDLDPFDYQLKS